MRLKEVRLKSQVEGLAVATSCSTLRAGEHEKKRNDPGHGWTLEAGAHWVLATNRDGRQFLIPWELLTTVPEVLQPAPAVELPVQDVQPGLGILPHELPLLAEQASRGQRKAKAG